TCLNAIRTIRHTIGAGVVTTGAGDLVHERGELVLCGAESLQPPGRARTGIQCAARSPGATGQQLRAPEELAVVGHLNRGQRAHPVGPCVVAILVWLEDRAQHVVDPLDSVNAEVDGVSPRPAHSGRAAPVLTLPRG